MANIEENPTEEVVEAPENMAEAADTATIAAQSDAGKCLVTEQQEHRKVLNEIETEIAKLKKESEIHIEAINKIKTSMLNLGTMASQRRGAIEALSMAIKKLESGENG